MGIRAVWSVVAKSGADVASNPGFVAAGSLAWAVPLLFVALSPRLPGTPGPALFIAGWTLLGPVTVGLWYGGHRIARGEAVDARILLDGLRRHLPTGFVFLIVNSVAIGLTIANIRFYGSSTEGFLAAPVPALGTTVGRLVALPWLYALIFWGLMQLYALPLIMAQEVGVGVGLRRAAILVLDNPLFTVGLAAVALVVMTACVLTIAGLLLLAGGVLAILTSNAAAEVLKRYQDSAS